MKLSEVAFVAFLVVLLAFAMAIGAVSAYREGWHPIFIVLFALGLPIIFALPALVETAWEQWSPGVLSHFWESTQVRVGSIFLVLICVCAVVAVLIVALDKDSSLTDLEVGDCVEERSGEIETLKHIDCSEPDALRVVAVFDLTDSGGWPGQAAIQVQAYQQCSWVPWVLGPTKDAWEKADDRRVVCLEEVR